MFAAGIELKQNANLPQRQKQVEMSNVTRSARKSHCSRAIASQCRRLIRRRSILTSSGRGQHVPSVTTRSLYRRTSLLNDICAAFQCAPPPTASTSTYGQRPRTGHDRLRSRPPCFNAASCVVRRSLVNSTSLCYQSQSDAVLRQARRRVMTTRPH